MKGLFIPGITAEMFRNGCLESIEALMAEGEIYDIDYQQPCEDTISREAVLDLCNSKDPDYKVIHLKEDVECLPPVTLRSLNPEADREKSKAYCAECDHIEMCSWYPHDGCEWLKTDRYNAGYNAAKREIALSGEYERAYERGKADAQPKTGHWITTRTFMHDGEYYCDKCKCDAPNNEKWDYCPNCGAKMVDPKESEE